MQFKLSLKFIMIFFTFLTRYTMTYWVCSYNSNNAKAPSWLDSPSNILSKQKKKKNCQEYKKKVFKKKYQV